MRISSSLIPNIDNFKVNYLSVFIAFGYGLVANSDMRKSAYERDRRVYIHA